MPLNVPNLLTWLRIVMIPLVIGVFYVPDAVADDLAPQPDRDRRVRRRGDHRLARRLSRAAPEPDIGVRRVSRPGRGQAR